MHFSRGPKRLFQIHLLEVRSGPNHLLCLYFSFAIREGGIPVFRKGEG